MVLEGAEGVPGELSTPNINPSALNGSPDAFRASSEHPLTLSDGNFSLGSAAVGVSPLESADPQVRRLGRPFGTKQSET